ncbi:replication initiation and membrane attachment protein [Caldalkalibacillus uzonensis]|uniref:Replication initiation and membrane attachment protein n=1 Tax=Caldalkalibacillus uzonensis TaxID=353224 RepID=A0ABU0CP16_9BACI|nr:DnaD domain protein [Caldalkalibacillus uzonensis]MDQ0337833.1 replication initiation and membrane attachment protein [Caldalkalibacillus uzonensis]
MTTTWKYVRPMDGYKVRVTEQPGLFQLKILYQLYQPLIGAESLSLYVTLFSETEGDRHYSNEKKHQWLMKVMALPLDRIYYARLRLEAVGLLRTYRLQTGEGALFHYELHPPLSAEQFFADDVLSIWLYNQVGPVHFKQLRARFAHYLGEAEEPEQAEELTKPFHEVFTSIHPSELTTQAGSQTQQDLQEAAQAYPLPKYSGRKGQALRFDDYELDLDLVKSFMMKGLDRDQIFTPENVQEIKKVAFFYQLDERRLSQLIQDSLTIDDCLDVAELRRQAKWHYHAQYGNPPRVRMIIPENGEEGEPKRRAKEQQAGSGGTAEEGRILSDEERHLQVLQTMSPLQLLGAYQDGGKVAEADVKLVEELIFDYQLEPSVVNVLIEYILLTNQFRLPRSLVTKVAAHWKRLKITDMRQALEVAKKEHQQYKKWQEKRQHGEGQSARQGSPLNKATRGGKRTGVRKDVIPAWVAEQDKYHSSPQANRKSIQNKTDQELAAATQTQALSEEQKRERIKSLLKALGEWEE